MHDVQDSDGVPAIGRGGTALDGESARHVHQNHRMMQSGSLGGQACPYPLKWRHACTALLGVVINQGVGLRVVDSLCAWQRSGGWAGHTGVLQVHRWNDGGEVCEEVERERGKCEIGDSHFGVRKVDGGLEVGVLKMVTVGGTVLAGARD